MKIGDKVKLKSGAPAMMIEGEGVSMDDGPQIWACVWFAEGKYHRDQFPEIVLQLIDSPT